MYWCAWSVTKLKTGSSSPKTVRTADTCMLSRMPLFVCGVFNVLSCSRCFGLQLPLLGFVADSVTVHAYEYVYLSTLRSSVSIFSVNLAITVRNVTSRNKYNDVWLQNRKLKFGVMPISYTWSNFRQNQHINEYNPAKQSYQIWHKNFQALPSNHILRVGSFFSRTLYSSDVSGTRSENWQPISCFVVINTPSTSQPLRSSNIIEQTHRSSSQPCKVALERVQWCCGHTLIIQTIPSRNHSLREEVPSQIQSRL